MTDIESRRKRLIFRSWHRGTREMDLLLGSFADSRVPWFGEAELAQYEEILGYSDPDLYDWVTGKVAAPSNYINDVFSLLLSHRFAS